MSDLLSLLLVNSLPSFQVGLGSFFSAPSILIRTDITYTKPPTSRNIARVAGSNENTLMTVRNRSIFIGTTEPLQECVDLSNVPKQKKPTLMFSAVTLMEAYFVPHFVRALTLWSLVLKLSYSCYDLFFLKVVFHCSHFVRADGANMFQLLL